MTTIDTNQAHDEAAPSSTEDSSVGVVPAIRLDGKFERVIEQSNDSIRDRLREAVVWRDLLLMLVQRDIKVRYRQTMFGIVWAVLVPLMSLGVYWVVFERLLHRGTSDGVPYPLFLFPAMIIWNYYSSSVGRAANALKHDAPILSKVYFPRLLLPVSNITSPLVDYAFGLGILVVILAMYQHSPTLNVLLLPAYLVLAIVAAAGMGFGLSVLNAHYRDVHHFLPVLLQLWFFCSPILYSTTDLVPERLRLLYAINPMVTVCEGARSCMLGTEIQITLGMGLVSCASAGLMFIVGLVTFMKLEQTVTDVI
ncbi:MAG: ABC transporter permease [Phycisphaerales bacterium]